MSFGPLLRCQPLSIDIIFLDVCVLKLSSIQNRTASRESAFAFHLYSHTTATRMVPAYTKCGVQLIKVAPEDGLTESETCTASNRK